MTFVPQDQFLHCYMVTGVDSVFCDKAVQGCLLFTPQVFFVSDLFKSRGRRSALLPTPVKKELVPPADIRERSNHLMVA